MAATLKIKNTFIYAALAFSLCCVMLVFFGAFYFSNKGFELSDETYYLYFSNNHNPDTFIVSNFGLFSHFFCFGNPTLSHLRIAKIIYQSMAVLFFCFAMFKFFDFKKFKVAFTERLFVIIITLMLSYCNYDYLPMTLSYNTWTFIFSLCCFGVFFLEQTYSVKWKQLVSALFVGLLLFCLMLVKLPAGIFLAFFYFILNVFVLRKYFFLKLLSALLGVLLAYFIFLNDVGYLQKIIHNYYVSLFEVKHAEANSYLGQMKNFWNLCVEKQYVLIELSVFLGAIIIKRFNSNFKTFFSFLLIIINLSFSFWFIKGNGEALYNDFLAGTIFLLTFILYVYLKETSDAKPGKEVYVLAALLFLAPFCLMLGTNNDFYYTVSHTMLFVVMALVLYAASTGKLNSGYLSLKSLFVCAFISGILYYGAVKNPYRQFDLTKKHYTLNFTKEINGVEESYEKYIDFSVLHTLINKQNKNNKPIVTFFNHFGLCYIADVAIYPESQLSDAERYIYVNEYVLDRFKFNDRFDLIVIPETVEKSDKFKQLFEKYGVKLNHNYKLTCSYELLSTKEKVFIYKHV